MSEPTTRLASFDALISAIGHAHAEMATQASRAVNASLTLRNWLIGLYIEAYERAGADRAQYGDQLMDKLALRLTEQGISRCDRREIYRYRQFYLTYPQIVDSVPPQFLLHGVAGSADGGSSTAPSIVETVSPQSQATDVTHASTPKNAIRGHTLLNRLSFSHIVELLKCSDATQRTFYEVECIQGNWSVRELKRQISSLYYERSGLSTDKARLSELTQAKAQAFAPSLTIRDPYVFEFLGLMPQEVMSESQLEDQLLNKLEGFLLELGHGFCFEARQKRILIGESSYFVDLVFYHRILKCHVLVELKLADFNHEHIGQLNTYVSWYRKNMMAAGDNPPIGILLCTQKDHALMEYALAGIDNDIFVSKYLLELPEKQAMQAFIEAQLAAGEK